MIPRVLVSQIPKPLTSQHLTLAILHRASVVVTCTVRVTTSTGIYTQSFTTTSDRVTRTLNISVAELPTSITILSDPTTVLRGQILIQGVLRVATVTIAALFTQYLSSGQPVYWPPGITENETKFPGELLTTVTADPAAGASLSYATSSASRMRVLSLRATLTTVGANTPLVLLTFETLTDFIFVLSAPLVHPAASARTYNFVANSPRNDTAFDANNNIVLSIPLIELAAESTITLSGQDADDNWGTAVIYVESLIEAAV